MFAEHGLSGTSIRDIAAATGYSNPALYKHFETKDALAYILFERCYKEAMARLSSAVEKEEGFSNRFSAYVLSYAEFYDSYPHAMIFISANLTVLWPHVAQNIGARTIVTLTRDLLKLGRKEGAVGKKEDISLQVILVIGTFGQLIRQLYLRALDGRATKHAKSLERMLRTGLS